MIKLYTQEEYDKCKSEGFLNLKCEQCGEAFESTKNKIQESIRKKSKRFCSKKCTQQSHIKKQIVKCLCCQKIF